MRKYINIESIMKIKIGQREPMRSNRYSPRVVNEKEIKIEMNKVDKEREREILYDDEPALVAGIGSKDDGTCPVKLMTAG